MGALNPAASSTSNDVLLAIRNLAKLGGSLGTTLLIGLVIRPLLRRSLGPDAFGPLDAADGFTATWFIVLGLGVDSYVRKEIPVRPQHAEDFFGSVLMLRLVLLAPICLGMAGVMWATERPHELQLLVWLLGATQFFQALNQTFAALLQANTTVDGLSLVNIGSKVLWAVGSFVGIALGWGIASIAAALLVAEALKAVVSWRLSQRYFRLEVGRFQWAPVKLIVLATLPYYLNNVFHTVYNKIDVFLLSVIASHRIGAQADQETGWYGAAASLGGLSMMVAPLIAGVLTPLLARARERDRAEYQHLVRRALEVVLVVVAPISLGLFIGAEEWLTLLYGPAYDEASGALQVLSVVYLMIYVSIISAVVLILENRAWTLAKISAAALVLNVTANLLVVGPVLSVYGPSYGAVACAVVQVCTEAAVSVTLLALIGHGAFDARTLSVLLKTACASVAVLAADAVLRRYFLQTPGFLRLFADAVLYSVVVLSLRAVVPKELFDLIRLAFRKRHENATV